MTDVNAFILAVNIKKAIFEDNFNIDGFYANGNIINQIIDSYNKKENKVVLCKFNKNLRSNGVTLTDLFGFGQKSSYYDVFYRILGYSFYKDLVNSMITDRRISNYNINLYFNNYESNGCIVYDIHLSPRQDRYNKY